jgi:myo-inositol-1(or 4)-monophosphatase
LTLDKYLQACKAAALAGAGAIAHTRILSVTTKQDYDVEHHAVVSEADYRSHEAILEVLRRIDRNVHFLGEEELEDRLPDTGPVAAVSPTVLEDGRAFIFDELDGSSSFAAGHYEWSVSVAYVERLVHKAGAIFAPAIWGGALFFGMQGGGAFLKANRRGTHRLHVAPAPISEAYLLIGLDTLLPRYPLHARLVSELAEASRTLNVSGSCALAMALVAAGRANALIQPPQSPWDWAAGKLLVEEAGGRVLFYELQSEGVRTLDRLSSNHYDPKRRAVGLVAGPESLASELLERLASIRIT